MPLNIVNNSIAHVELPTTDFAKSKEFYSTVFGWKCEEIPQMNYMIFSLEGGVGGGFNKVEKVVDKTGHMAYITVEDIPATLSKIEKVGGSTAMPKTDLGNNWGFIAQFKDTCGVTGGLWAKN